VHELSDIDEGLIRSRFQSFNESITNLAITKQVVGSIPLRRQLSHSSNQLVVATTVSGKYPYATQPPPHLSALSSYFNISLMATTLGFSKCIDSQAILCPAGTHHDPLLSVTTSEDQCLGCPMGTSCAPGSLVPTTCSPGSFSNSSNASVCDLCAAGSFQEASGASSCQVCRRGFYCPPGSSAPQPCAAGTFQSALGAISAAACQTSAAGSFTSVGSQSFTLCPPGSFAASAASAVCTLCPAGKYQMAIGATVCSSCTPGFFCPFGSSAAKPCDAGSYLQDPGGQNASECMGVAAGFYSTRGSALPIPCPSVLSTYTCPGRAADTVNAIPGSAPVGKPVPQWIADLTIQADLQLSCPPGREAFGASCAPCRKGHYCIGGQALRCLDGTWHNLTGQASNNSCMSCPSVGSRCLTGDTLEVLPGYFMATYKDEFSYKCASVAACLGGPLTFGEDSCSQGHTGMICGGCKPGWYRGRRRCLSCVDLSDGSEDALAATKTGTILGAASMLLLLFLVLLLFLRPPEAAGTCLQSLTEMLKPTLERFQLDVSVALQHVGPLFSGLFKILLSYAQCLGAISRFTQVKWPAAFVNFMNMMNELLPELLTVLPAECVAGERLGFQVELYSTLSMPIMGFIFTWLVVSFIRLSSINKRRGGKESIFADEYGNDPVRIRNAAMRQAIRKATGEADDSDDEEGDKELAPPMDYMGYSWFTTLCMSIRNASGHPKILNVYIFMMLWVYPMLCRKSLATFDCIAAGVDASGAAVYLLRDDPLVYCFTRSWILPAAAAGAGIVFYSLGVPFAAWWLAYAHRRDVRREEAEEKERLELRLVAKVGRKKWRKGSSLLARIYKDEFWFCEPASLLHNFFFTGVIHIVMPETRVQIWVGVFMSLLTYIAFLLTKPYKYFICTMTQSAALLQVLLTYITAFLFYRDATLSDNVDDQSVEHSDEMGVVLVGINCICFLAMTVGTILGIRRQQRHHAVGQLRVKLKERYAKETGRNAKEMLVFAKHLSGEAVDEDEESLKFHTFLSHVWSSAQDQMRFLKTRLLTMVPDARIFLDVDDLVEGFGAEAVLDCASVLIFVSEGYFESKNCVRELLVAAQARKEMITVLELDVNRWKTVQKAPTRNTALLDLLKGEIFTKLLQAEERFDEWFALEQWYIEGARPTAQGLFDDLFRQDPIEWNRLTEFQNETLRLIAIRLLKPKYDVDRGFLAYVPGANQSVTLPPPREGYDYHMFISSFNPTVFKLRDEMNACLKYQMKGKRRADLHYASLLKTAVGESEGDKAAENPEEARKATVEAMKKSEIFLLHLTGDTWDDPERSRKLAADVVDAMRHRVRIVLAHEMSGTEDKERFACGFELFFSSDENGVSITPRFLKDAGIYSVIANPLKGSAFREISLLLLLRNIVTPPRPGLPNPFQNDENLSKSAYSFMSASSLSTSLLRRRLKLAAAIVSKVRNTTSARCYAPPKPPLSSRLPGRARILSDVPPSAVGSSSADLAARSASERRSSVSVHAPSLRRLQVASGSLGLPVEQGNGSQLRRAAPDLGGTLLRDLLGAAGRMDEREDAARLEPIDFGVPATPTYLKRIARPPPKIRPCRPPRGGTRAHRTAPTAAKPRSDDGVPSVAEDASETYSDESGPAGYAACDFATRAGGETTGLGGYVTTAVATPHDALDHTLNADPDATSGCAPLVASFLPAPNMRLPPREITASERLPPSAPRLRPLAPREHPTLDPE
jgi:hypothetical protein